MTIRPSTDTGVLFALVSNETVPLALSIVDSNSSDSQVILQLQQLRAQASSHVSHLSSLSHLTRYSAFEKKVKLKRSYLQLTCSGAGRLN